MEQVCIEMAITAAYDTINNYILQTEQGITRYRAEGDATGVEEMRRRINLLEELKRKIIAEIEKTT
ncbi:MAG: hypothetical protein V1736_07115 [Pseudomonadota bacterium]